MAAIPKQVVGRAISQQPAQLDSRDQARQPDRRRSQPRRAVATLGAAGGGRKPEAARHRLHRHLLPAQGRPCDAAGGDRARDGRPDAAGQDPLFRRLELPRLARRRDLQHLRPARHRPPDRQPALLQRHEPDARGRAFSGLRLLRPRHRALQPAGARRADRQVRAGRRARQGDACGPQGQAHDADRVAAGIAEARAGDQAATRKHAASLPASSRCPGC